MLPHRILFLSPLSTALEIMLEPFTRDECIGLSEGALRGRSRRGVYLRDTRWPNVFDCDQESFHHLQAIPFGRPAIGLGSFGGGPLSDRPPRNQVGPWRRSGGNSPISNGPCCRCFQTVGGVGRVRGVFPFALLVIPQAHYYSAATHPVYVLLGFGADRQTQ